MNGKEALDTFLVSFGDHSPMMDAHHRALVQIATGLTVKELLASTVLLAVVVPGDHDHYLTFDAMLQSERGDWLVFSLAGDDLRRFAPRERAASFVREVNEHIPHVLFEEGTVPRARWTTEMAQHVEDVD